MTTEKVFVALLDERGVYQGKTEVHAEDLQSGSIVVPADCDLEPGKYIWKGETFLPLRERKLSLEELHFKAVYFFMRDVVAWCDAQRAKGMPAPPVFQYTREWLEWYRGKLDDGTDYPYQEPDAKGAQPK